MARDREWVGIYVFWQRIEQVEIMCIPCVFRGSIYSAIIYYSIDTFPVFEVCARRYCSGDGEAGDHRNYLHLGVHESR